MSKSATKSAPAPKAENAALAIEPKPVVTHMGAPPAPAGESADPVADPVESAESMEALDAALGIKPGAAKPEEQEGDGEEETPESEQAEAEEGEAEETPSDDWSDPNYPERPEGVPAKFKNMAAFAKSYSELEKALHKKGALKIETGADGKPAEAGAAKALTAEEMGAYAQEWAEKGSLSDESFAALEARGYPKEIVSDYMALKMEQRDRAADSALAKAGLDRAAFGQMAEWAASNMTAAEVEGINSLLASTNPVHWEAGMLRLKSAYSAVNKPARARVAGGTSAASTLKPFGTQAEVAAAVGDPRYGDDPAYTEEVDKRIARSVARR